MGMCGNIGFGPDPIDEEKSVCTTNTELNQLADLYGLSEMQLTLAFTERTMKTRTESFKVPLKHNVAKESCDAFAKEIYAKLFLWLVDQINKATAAENHYHMKDTVEY